MSQNGYDSRRQIDLEFRIRGLLANRFLGNKIVDLRLSTSRPRMTAVPILPFSSPDQSDNTPTEFPLETDFFIAFPVED